MAWIFSLSVECGTLDAAQAVVRHFEGFTAIPGNGISYPCHPRVFKYEDDWWAMICPADVTRVGIQNEEERATLTAIALLLYERLRSAPSFRFAMAGVEVDAFRTIRGLDREDFALDGLVASEKIREQLNWPDTMPHFSPGYRWCPLVSLS